MKFSEICMKIDRIMAFQHRTSNLERRTLNFQQKNRWHKP